MLKELLGTQYSYVKECLYSISDDVSYLDGRYFMKGGMPGMYTIMEAAVSLSETGSLNVHFLKMASVIIIQTLQTYMILRQSR